MQRIGFRMKVNPAFAKEYERRHDSIWPELSALLSGCGITDYTIYLDPKTGDLFAHSRRIPNADIEGLMRDPLMRKWWQYMGDIMETNPDGSPVTLPLIEVFHMD